MIAKASYLNVAPEYYGAYYPVIQAQNEVIAEGVQTFAGPNTDEVTNSSHYGYRDWLDLHFSYPLGMNFFAQMWMDSIKANGNYFMNNAIPVTANEPPAISASINASNQVILTVPSGYAGYKWIRTDLSGNHSFEGTASVGSTRQITVTPGGTYRCWVVSSNGNLQVSVPVKTNEALSLAQNTGDCSMQPYLSDYKYIYAQNDRGPVEFNKTVGLEGDGDGTNIYLKSVKYNNGISTFGNSEIKFRLPEGVYNKFSVKIGIPDNISTSCVAGGVKFKVVADENVLYYGGLLNRNSALISLDMDIWNKKTITLITEAPVASNCNEAVWASPVLSCEPPAPPANLTLTDTLTKCVHYSWDASTGSVPIVGYQILHNGVIVDTVASPGLSYMLKGLTPGSTLYFGVKAIDQRGMLSAMTADTVIVPEITLEYMGADGGFLCNSKIYLPTQLIPLGGVFKLTPVGGPPYVGTIDSLSGAFSSSEPNGVFEINYQISKAVPECHDELNLVFGTTAPPTPAVITSDIYIGNLGQIANITSSVCSGGSSLKWSFTESVSNPITEILTTTQTYFAECRKDLCHVKSNEITIQVLDDCYSSLNLTKPGNNLVGNTNPIRYSATGGIQANNIISPTNKVDYNSQKSITLNPGFTVEPGVIFKAEIKNCP